jgi:hypothetical protein
VRRAAILATLVAAAASSARADDACTDALDEPAAVPWRDAGWDAGRGACLRADVSATVRGRALVDTPAFYGTLGGDLALALRQTVGARAAWGVTVRALDVAFVQNAVWKLVEPDYGPVLVHGALATDARLGGRPAKLALFAEAELPFSRGALTPSSGAAQLAALATWRVRPRLQLHGRVAALGWYGHDVTGTTTRAAALASVDSTWRAACGVAIAGGVDAQAGWYQGGLDHLAVRVGAQLRVASRWRLGLAVGAPLVGRERQDLALALGVKRDL